MSLLHDVKIVVTGAEGFLGSFVLRKLAERGIDANNIVTTQFPEHDLRKYEDCRAVLRDSSVVIHLAGVVGGIEFSNRHPGKTFYDNAAMALNMLEASRQAGIKKFVGIGSVCEYPENAPTPFREDSVWQGYPAETHGAYGLAKRFMLAQSQAYRAEYGLHAVHLLMGNLYGPGDNFRVASSHVVPAIIRRVAEAKEKGERSMIAWGTGNPTRDFLYVEDAAEAILLATEQYDKADPVNLGSGREISMKELVGHICALMEFEGEVTWDTARPDGQPRRVLDISKAKQEFGFAAKTDLMEGLQKTIDYYYGIRS